MAAKTGSPHSELKRLLDAKEPAGTYFFHGTEEQRIKKAVKEIKSRFLKDADPSVAWTVHDLGETGFGNLLDDMRTVSFFGGRRGVQAINIDGGKTKSGVRLSDKDQALLLEYLDNPSPDVIFVISTGKVDQRIKFWKELIKKTAAISFESNERERKFIIADKLKEHSLSFGRDAGNWMAERFANRVPQLDGELEKLAVYMGERKEVAIDDLEECISTVKMHNVFQLTKAIGMRKVDESLLALKSLKTEGEAILMVMAMIARQFRILLILRSCMDDRLSREETISQCRIPPYFFNEYREQAGLLSTGKLKRIIYTLSGINMKLRTSSMNDWMILEEEIISLIEPDRVGIS